MLGSGGDGRTGDLGIVARLGFGGRNVADELEQASMVEPVHPVEGSELHRLGMMPGTTPADHLGLEEPDHRLRQGIVVAVADAADRRLDAGLGKPLTKPVSADRETRQPTMRRAKASMTKAT